MLDTTNCGQIDYQEFLVGLRGRMNAKRQAMVDKAFLRFDKCGDSYICVRDLKPVYNSDFHPKVIDGSMTKEQCFVEFVSYFGDKKEIITRRVIFNHNVLGMEQLLCRRKLSHRQ